MGTSYPTAARARAIKIHGPRLFTQIANAGDYRGRLAAGGDVLIVESINRVDDRRPSRTGLRLEWPNLFCSPVFAWSKRVFRNGFGFVAGGSSRCRSL